MSKATSNTHDWHCEEHDTYGWRGEACRKCPTAASEITALREQVEKLTKERDAWKIDAIHGGNAAYLREELAVLAEQNEKQRAFLEFAWKDIPMNEYAFKILEHTMNLPNLAAPVLNRIRAEGMRMAAQFIEDKYDFLGEEITVADEIRARADELEQSK